MTDFSSARILITGGLGFIGSNLAIRLVELGAKVTVIDSLIPEYGGNLKNVEPIKDRISINISDVRDEHSMKYLIRGHDILFNLAGQTSHLDSMHNPLPDLEINARAQLSILEACRRHNPGIKIVFASTRQIYGVPQSLPVDERHILKPVDVNGINKIAGESYHLLYHAAYGIRTTALRLTNTYGPRMRIKDARQTFLGVWIKQAILEEPILVYGDGMQIRDFNYVDDVVEAFLLAAATSESDGEVFNLGAEDPMNLKSTAQLIIEIANKGSFTMTPFPGDLKRIDIGDYYADYRKIRAKLGWTPKISFQDGISRTLNYFNEHGKDYLE